MRSGWRKYARWDTVGLAVLLAMPALLGTSSTDELVNLFVFGILALGLNVVTGYTGLLHLGIAAFFGLGAYITGILTVPSYPFQVGFVWALVASVVGAAAMGAVLGAPTLRLRGDYLALVTLGFGEVVKVTLRNMEEITAGTKTLSPLPGLTAPGWLQDFANRFGIVDIDQRLMYYVALALLALTVAMLRNLERSPLGRAWVALREDELAATCMGINAARTKLAAFALGAALAGMAGCLHATRLTSTADPNAYDFNRSIIILCCLILGGLGSIRGALLGVALLVGYENVAAPWLDSRLQESGVRDAAVERIRQGFPEQDWLAAKVGELLTFSNWNLMLFGLALILMMRYRPEGLLPSKRIQMELHEQDSAASAGPVSTG